MAITVSFSDNVYGVENLDAFMARLDETNSEPLEKREAYQVEGVMKYYYYFKAYQGRVIKIEDRWDSMSERSWWEATVADTDKDGKRVWKTFAAGNNDRADASPELMQEYQDHLDYLKRKHRVMRRWEERQAEVRQAKETKLARTDIKRLQRVFYGTQYLTVVKLLSSYASGKLRSEFKKSLAKQILGWIENPKYRTPLSAKQMTYL